MDTTTATVEIVKAIIGPNNEHNSTYLYTDQAMKTEFLKFIEELYNTIEKLRKNNGPISKQF